MARGRKRPYRIMISTNDGEPSCFATYTSEESAIETLNAMGYKPCGEYWYCEHVWPDCHYRHVAKIIDSRKEA